VYTRLGVSLIHGVGAVAIRDIKKGTLVFAPDDDDTVKIPKQRTEQLPPAIKALYHDFCVLEDGKYECPVSFNKLTPAWYVNDCGQDEPNVAPDSDLRFKALRDIKAGEELLARYADYSRRTTGLTECEGAPAPPGEWPSRWRAAHLPGGRPDA
jgi:hypothetical protein